MRYFMADEKNYQCHHCLAVMEKQGKTSCSSAPGTIKAPAVCPGKEEQLVQDCFERYTDETEEGRLARVAARVEGMCYQNNADDTSVHPRWTRVEDTIALAKLMDYHTVGIATCLGLIQETGQLAEILEAQGFEVVSVCCKAGGVDKMGLGIDEQDKVRPGHFEAACNPIAQAEFLNRSQTDMNIIVGLCVGHDMLFNKHSAAPVTTLVVKDRVTGHNPVSVLYGQNFYYKRLKLQPLKID